MVQLVSTEQRAHQKCRNGLSRMMYGATLKLYLDNNVYNRPFDDLRVPRNQDEARAVQELLKKAGMGEVILVSSFVV